jgi:putative ABC transport system ATP-binding protein
VTAPAHPPVRLAAIRKTYGRGGSAVTALDGVTVDFPTGTFTAVMGPSGSGKSTLLHCAAGLDAPTSGEVTLAGTPLAGLGETELTLMPALDVWQNVTLPDNLAGRRTDKKWVREVIERVGLRDRVHHRPAELSGGQQQRVAIARALASRPAVTFADEPTGALDTRTAAEVLGLMRHLADAGQTIVMVTHDPVAASYADQVLFLVDGRIVDHVAQPTAAAVAARLANLGATVEGAR